MVDFEKLGVFYLGREYDLQRQAANDNLILYDSKDLVTHAVCVGMTGSGKTGLCIGLLEEAAIDGIPAIAIDPKGDLANLLLTFPKLEAADFLPWINDDDARNKGLTAQQYAEQQAQKWKEGLAQSGQDGARIQRLRNAADFTIYTPGSTAGTPVSILKSFASPGSSITSDPELLRERILTTVTGLLGLLGVQANPLQSREHILLSTILDVAWKNGQDLDLPAIIGQIQNPPVTRIGVLDVESFFPARDRFQLSMMLNNLLAAPGFDLWMQGSDLDPASLLYTGAGKPRVAIFSIAHLNDAERMFFVTLLLTQILGWMRAQSGTGSLRAILYMDEIFGYFPPVANPPSKTPLLTLLKQGRAFGVGTVLATQNPVDLDYKGLANAGTWFIGRLQTEQDKARLLDGLESAASQARFDRSKIESILSNLPGRVFLMNNAHEDQPQIFQTRWTLSYLRGPLTRAQIQQLRSGESSVPVQSAKPAAPASQAAGSTTARPVLPPAVPQFYLPVRGNAENATVIYRPKLLGLGAVYYADAKAGIAFEQQIAAMLSLSDAGDVDWQNSESATVKESDLERFPAEAASYEDLPAVAAQAKSYDRWNKAFAEWLFRAQGLSLLRSPSYSIISKPGESEKDFRIRLQQTSREQRDRAVEQLRKKYSFKIDALQDRLRRAQQAVDREAEQAKNAKVQTAISFGTTVLGALFGRKRLSMSTLGRATTAARGVGRSMKESEDIGRAQETVESLQGQLADLEAELKTETDSLTSAMDPQSEKLESVELKPKKANVSVKLVALLWTV